jgi:hypothetical protein
LSLCFNWAPRHDLGTRRRWVVSFTPRPLYHQGKNPWYPLDLKFFHYLSSIKLKMSLCFLAEHHAMKAYWECGGISPFILWPWH